MEQRSWHRTYAAADAHNCVAQCRARLVNRCRRRRDLRGRWASLTVYDVLIVKMTSRWYATVLKDLGKNSTLLDVGIGTATALGTTSRLWTQDRASPG